MFPDKINLDNTKLEDNIDNPKLIINITYQKEEYKCHQCHKLFLHHSSLSRHNKLTHKKSETLLSQLLKNRKN